MKKWPIVVAGFLLLLLLSVQPVYSADKDLIQEAKQFFKPLPEMMADPEDNPATEDALFRTPAVKERYHQL